MNIHFIAGHGFPKQLQEMSWNDVSVSPTTCPEGGENDDCYELDFPGTQFDDEILIKYKAGLLFGEGKLKNRPDVRVLTFRKTNLDNDVLIEVRFKFLTLARLFPM